MYRNFALVPKIIFGRNSFVQLEDILAEKRSKDGFMIFALDSVFMGQNLQNCLPMQKDDMLLPIPTAEEPKTSDIDAYVQTIRDYSDRCPDGIIGIGGGITMDCAKAISLLLTNQGSAADYQGWDLIRKPAIYHVGVPTLSGTGAEISRTCILTGPDKKLGINSDFTLFDQIVLDPELTQGVPKEQWFYTGMDCFLHNIESLNGYNFNSFSKAYAEKSIELCREVFLEDAPESDEKLMMASYFGGMSIAYSQVGACHALSYGLSYVLGIHHGVGCCIAFNVLDDIYPEGVTEFRKMMDKHNIVLPKVVSTGLEEVVLEKMIDTTLNLVPLWENCLGKDWQNLMTRDRTRDLYLQM